MLGAIELLTPLSDTFHWYRGSGLSKWMMVWTRLNTAGPMFSRLAVAASTGDVLMTRLRKGRANTTWGAANFLGETVSRVRYAGATGPLTVRADCGFCTQQIAAACRDKSVRFSITVRQQPSVRNLIEAMPELEWTPIS